MNAKAQAVVTTIPMQEASLDIWNSKYQLKTKTGEPVERVITGGCGVVFHGPSIMSMNVPKGKR